MFPEYDMHIVMYVICNIFLFLNIHKFSEALTIWERVTHFDVVEPSTAKHITMYVAQSKHFLVIV